MKYGTVNLGQIEALLNKIGGVHGMYAILREKLEITMKWKCWQTIQLGTYPNAESLRKALTDAGHDTTQIRDDIEISQPRSVNLVLLRVADLGLGGNVYTKDIYEVANKLGLMLCPEETAAQLLLHGYPPIADADNRFIRLQFATDPKKRNGNGYRIEELEGKRGLDRFSNTEYYTRRGSDWFVFVSA